jgi:hypothetical protein
MTVLIHILDPLISLALRINNERPTPTVKDEDAVIGGESISW